MAIALVTPHCCLLTTIGQANSIISCHKDHQSPHCSRVVCIPHTKNVSLRRVRSRVPGRTKPRLRFRSLASSQSIVGYLARRSGTVQLAYLLIRNIADQRGRIRQTLPDVSIEELSKAYETAHGHVRAARLTDAEFIYTPSQIALACFSLASPTLATAWARAKFPSSPQPAALEFLEPIKEIILRDGSPPDVEAVREVDRRLRLCKNPEKIPGTNAYIKKQQEKDRQADEKRLRKAEAARIAMEEGDPFGSELAKKAAEDLDDDDDDD